MDNDVVVEMLVLSFTEGMKDMKKTDTHTRKRHVAGLDRL